MDLLKHQTSMQMDSTKRFPKFPPRRPARAASLFNILVRKQQPQSLCDLHLRTYIACTPIADNADTNIFKHHNTDYI